MKSKIWLYHLPIVAFFTWCFWVQEAGLRGDIQSTWIRERVFPILHNISGLHTNFKFHVRGPQPPKNKIVIVEIDNDSIADIGRWPWHRDKTAQLVQSIFDAGAKHVGLDITFSEPDQRVSPAMVELLEKNRLGDQVKNLETDPTLENAIIFNSENLTLGWMAAFCQPSFATNSEECPVASPDAPAIHQTDMAKFSIPDVRYDAPFNIAQTPLMSTAEFIRNLPSYNAAASFQGYLDITPDRDGYIRRAMLVMAASDGHLYPSLALAMAAALKKEKIYASVDSRFRIKELGFSGGSLRIPTSPLGLMDINFRGPAQTFQYIKAKQVMSAGDEILVDENRTIASKSKKELLKDSIVLVGLTAVGVFDMRAFPYDSNTPGVEGHANILDNLLSNDMLHHGDSKTGTLVLYLLMTLGALLFAILVEKLESIPALIVFVGFLGGGFFIDQKVLFENNQNWNTSIFLLEVGVIFLFTFAVKYILEEKDKRFIRGAFAKYVSPAIIESIMKDPAKLTVGGEKKDLTVLFSDIRSFTTSEKLEPKILANFLNDYLGKMTDIVFDTGGTLDKYIGDAVMAFWGAPLDQPLHAANALNAAIQMQQLLEKLRPEYRAKYGVEVNVGVGLNSGAVNVGNMGSERIFEYTVIGDHVNLASRLESLTKEFHAEILTSRGTFDSIVAAGQPLPPHRVLDFLKVKGKKNAVELIQVFIRPMSDEGLKIYNEARALYTAQKWDEAIALFEKSARILAHDGLPDGMSLVFIERCNEFKQMPPGPDWDGAWIMKTK